MICGDISPILPVLSHRNCQKLVGEQMIKKKKKIKNMFMSSRYGGFGLAFDQLKKTDWLFSCRVTWLSASVSQGWVGAPNLEMVVRWWEAYHTWSCIQWVYRTTILCNWQMKHSSVWRQSSCGKFHQTKNKQQQAKKERKNKNKNQNKANHRRSSIAIPMNWWVTPQQVPTAPN